MSEGMSGEFKPDNKPDSIENYLNVFKRLKDNYSNDIPEEIVHSDAIDSKFKIRRGWFSALVGQFLLFKEDYLDNIRDRKNEESVDSEDDDKEIEKLLADIEAFITYCTSKEFQLVERITAEDVDTGDGILDRVISHLEKLELEKKDENKS
jgi:hypothetical protein